jgi:hypothetical protein
MSGVILHSVSNDHPATYHHSFLHTQASVDTPDAGYKSAKFETDLFSTSRDMLRQSRLKTFGYNLGYRVFSFLLFTGYKYSDKTADKGAV